MKSDYWEELLLKFMDRKPQGNCGNGAAVRAVGMLRNSCPEKGRLLNAGSGHGDHSRMFAKEGFSVVNIDINEYPDIHMIKGDIHAIEGFDDSFDVVFCSHTLEHVLSPVIVLNEFNKVLKPKGMLLIVAPKYEPSWVYTKGHYYVFTPMQLESVLNQTGFELVEIIEDAGDASMIITARKRVGSAPWDLNTTHRAKS